MLICIILCFLALIPKIVFLIYNYIKAKNPGTTFPKERAPYEVGENNLVNTANKIGKKNPNETKLEDDFGKEDPNKSPYATFPTE